MKSNLIQQYQNIRETINKNVDTIKLMVQQAKQISQIAESLSGEECKDTRSKLEDQISKLNQSIGALIDDTTELFRLYSDFANELFDKK